MPLQAERSGNIGVPIPGTELKLVPSGDKFEVRVRGPNVTPGKLNKLCVRTAESRPNARPVPSRRDQGREG